MRSDSRAFLVRGRPWIGKSYLFDATCGQRNDLNLGTFFWMTQLQDHPQGKDIVPGTWNEWKASDKPGCWLIDSLDEGEIVQPKLCNLFVDQLDLIGESCRRLRVIFFSRSEPFLEPFSRRINQLYGDQFVDLALLPLQRDDARRWAGEQAFSETLVAIQRFDLQKVCALPTAFEYIKDHRDDSLSVVDVWKGVLSELLPEKSKNPKRQPTATEEIEDRFKAAARLATVMTFADVSEVCDGGPTSVRRVDEFLAQRRGDAKAQRRLRKN